MKKRLLSILLTLCILLSIVPVSALADDTALRSVAVQSIGPNEAEVELDLYEKMSAQVSVIKLISDIELSGSLQVDYAVTINLNGHVLKMGDIADGSVIKVNDGGHLTLIDSAPDAEHKFTTNADGLWVLDETGGTKTVNGGVIYGGNAERGGGVYIEPGGQLTMNGGSIVGCYANSGGGVKVDCDETKGSKFTMNSGAIIGCVAKGDGGGVETQANAGNELHGAFIMNGGVIEYCVGENYGGVYCSGTFTMNGGTIQYCRATEETDPAKQKGGIFLSGRGRNIINGTIISGDVVDTQHIFVNEPVTIGANADIRANMYSNGYTIALVDGVTYKTIYGKITNGRYADGLAAVTYQVNGGDYATQIVRSGSTATRPIDPTVTGSYEFDGWFRTDGTRWDYSNDTVTENVTLTGYRYLHVIDENTLADALRGSAEVIRLTEDIDISASLTILRKVTLDLNGHVLKMTGSGSVIILDNSNGTTTGNLTLIDSNPTAEHKFKVNGVEPWVPDDSGTETVYGGIITGGNAENGGGVYVKNGGEFTMTAGNIVGCTAKYGGGLYLQQSSFTMNGGSIVGCSSTSRVAGEPLSSGIHCSGSNVYKEKPNVITLTGGLIKNNGRYDINAIYNTIIYANGGEIYGKVGVYQACKITGLAGKTGVTTFRGWTRIEGASNIPENISHVDWGLFYGGLGISGDTTTGIIVTYKDGDTEYAKQALPSAGLATCPDALGDKTGYTFGGWNKADGTAWDFTKDTVTENITLSAKWIPHTYTVTFDSTGGSEVTTKTMTATYGKPLANMPVPRREGYVFLGWYDAMVGGKCYGNSDGNGTSAYDKDGNITLYAQWTVAPSHMVYFNTCGGTMTGSTEVLHKTNTPIAKPSDPTKVGYTFTGWYTDSAFTQAWNFDDWVTGELRLYAGWTVNQYTITIKPENGEADTIIKQDFGTAVTAPNLTKTGYTFMGWDKTFPTTMPAENITVTARWKDSEKPTGKIKISENSWKSFLDNITFGLFFKDTQTVTINAADNSGETVTVEYLLSNKELTKAELDGMTFTAYTAPFGIDPDNEYIIYVKLTDTAGNTDYICSDGIVLDGTSPVITGIENGKTYCEAQTVTVDEKYVDTVTVNGTEVTLDENGSFVLSPADGEQKIVVTDKAGNTAEMTVTVNDGHTFGEWTSNGDGTHTRQCTADGCTEGVETDNCTDEDKNHKCDICDYIISECADTDKNHICDICGKIISNHEDANKDHVCDYCGKVTSNHEDADKDHVCDYCGKTISNHEDADKDHICDYCGKTISNHEDADKDHICDYCGKTISNHEDADKDHICDYCGKVITNHEDADKDHVCDYCGKTISNHEDANKDHVCDYCGKTITNHEDANKDHVCDYCGKTISNHEDANKDHVCDYCGKTISNHEDANKDHACDYCGKVLTNHIGGKETCRDKAVCEVCGKSYGELDAKNHTDLKHFPAKVATKTTEGNIEYWYCEGCGKYFNDKDGIKEIKKADTVMAKLKDDSKSPQTGDTSNLALWIVLLFVSDGAVIGTTVVSRKKKYNR